MPTTKDINTIEVQYLADSGKKTAKIRLCSLLTRADALAIAAAIEASGDVARVRCWTTSGTFI